MKNELKKVRDELMSALEETSAVNGFECEHGFRLGKCPNKDCLPTVIFNSIKKIDELIIKG